MILIFCIRRMYAAIDCLSISLRLSDCQPIYVCVCVCREQIHFNEVASLFPWWMNIDVCARVKPRRPINRLPLSAPFKCVFLIFFPSAICEQCEHFIGSYHKHMVDLGLRVIAPKRSALFHALPTSFWFFFFSYVVSGFMWSFFFSTTFLMICSNLYPQITRASST